MDGTVIVFAVITVLLLVSNIILAVFVVLKNKNNRGISEEDLRTENKRLGDEISRLVGVVQTNLATQLDSSAGIQNKQMHEMAQLNANAISQLNKTVAEQLAKMNRDIGQMQSLAGGVDELKKILSNVKRRGILGEVQLGALISEMLSPYQYETNVATKKGSRDVVEFALKLPADTDNGPLYIPIDSKFPVEAYIRLCNAREENSDDTAVISACEKELFTAIKKSAKDICDKYINPPQTADFGIMFLPSEGLYSEVIANTELFETLKNDFGVLVTGPSTLCAFLSSVQLGFKSLAVQRHASDVWNTLKNVKSEFENFASVLETAQKHITQANDSLDKLVGVRTRKILLQLDKIEEVEE